MADERSKLIRRHAGHRRATLFVVATEGTYTEKQYLDALKLNGLIDRTRVVVEVIETPLASTRSAPAHVFERLKEQERRLRKLPGDEFWLVVDVDRWNTGGALSTVVAQAHQAGYRFGISNACFEVWLALHFVSALSPYSDCRQVKQFLKDQLGGYNEANLRSDVFTREKVVAAIERARQLDAHADNPTVRWPPAPSATHVYRLIERVLAPAV